MATVRLIPRLSPWDTKLDLNIKLILHYDARLVYVKNQRISSDNYQNSSSTLVACLTSALALDARMKYT